MQKECLKTLIIHDYHDLYIQSDTLLLADVFENFRRMCIKIFKIYEQIMFIFYQHP